MGSLDFKFYLDAIEVDSPLNWEEFSISIRHSEDVRGRITEFTNSLEFWGAEYTTLYSKISLNDICNPVIFSVEFTTDSGISFSNFFEANIHVSDIEFDKVRRRAKVQCEDITFSSLIYNNRSIEFSTNLIESKNGAVISAPGKGFEGYRYDFLMQYILDYITDGQVVFQDNWYDALDDYGILPTFKEHIEYRSDTFQDFVVTFDRVWVDIAKLYNLGFSLIYDSYSGEYIFTVDDVDGFYSPVTGCAITAFEDFLIKLNEDKLYTSVRVGDGNGSPFNPRVEQIFSQNKLECFGVLDAPISGQCGISGNSLDLSTKNTSYATNYFPSDDGFKIVQTRRQVSSGNYFVLADTLNREMTRFSAPFGSDGGEFGAPVTVGAKYLQNAYVLARYPLIGDVIITVDSDPLYSLTVLCDPMQNITTVGESVTVDFLNTAGGASDPRGLWSNSDHNYTTSSFKDRVYSARINCQIDVSVNGFTGDPSLGASLFYSEGGTDYRVDFATSGSFSGGSFTFTLTDFDVNMPSANGTIRIDVSPGPGIGGTGTVDIDIDTTSALTITQLGSQGGTLSTADPASVKCYDIDIEAPLRVGDFLTMLHDPRKNIALNIFSDATAYAWIKDVTFNPSKGLLSGTFVTDWNNLNADT